MENNNFTDENLSGNDKEQLDENFWEEICLPGKQKKKSPLVTFFRLIFCVAIFASGFAIAMITARGNGWLANLVSGDKHIEFTLPMEDKPQTDSSLKQSDGRYTSQGLAEAVSPSVVVLDVYSENRELLPSGQGSGVIISRNGYIVTNAHVVENGAHIRVVLNNGTAYDAKLIGSDSKNDIAVVKIEASDLQPAQFGKSSQASLGEEVMTIGTPGGYEGTVTKGIISGLNRRIRFETGSIDNCIQIDAAINPGNSGGALFNMWGQVIGITSSKLASENYDGIGFAISSDTAKPVIERLMSGKMEEPKVKIGITYYKVDENMAEKGDIDAGLVVNGISKDYPVYKSGLKKGDIITEIDGKKATEYEDLGEYIQKKGEGSTIKCKISRYKDRKKTEEKEIEIELALDNAVVEK